MNEFQELQIDVGLEILDARIAAGLTQTRLARKTKTKQPSIARAERGRVMPSAALLHKIAKATGRVLIITLAPPNPTKEV